MGAPRAKLVCVVAIVILFVLQAPAFATPAEPVRVIVGFRHFANVDLLRSFGAQISYVYQYIPAIAAAVSPLVIDVLNKNTQIAYVEPDYEVRTMSQYLAIQPAQTTQQTPWGISKINAPNAWNSFGDMGAGVKVAIVDTGIDISHRDLKVAGGISYVFGVSSYNDDNGHGTHVAGIVAALDNSVGVVGVAPAASLYAVKVLNSRGSGYVSVINKGIEWSITNKMQIISMSLGSTSDSTSLHQECDKAYTAGIVVVAAAGNSGPNDNTVNYPGAYSSVIAVGATDSNDVIATFSSRGSQLSVTAPGVDVYSTYKGSSYATMSGTSMATPHVTGTVALILARSSKTPAQVRTILQDNAVDLGTFGWDSTYGYGRIDAYNAVSAAGGSTTTQSATTTSTTQTVTSTSTTQSMTTTSTKTSTSVTTSSTRTSTRTSTSTTTSRWTWTWPWGRTASTGTNSLLKGQNTGSEPEYSYVPLISYWNLIGMLTALTAVLGIILPSKAKRGTESRRPV